MSPADQIRHDFQTLYIREPTVLIRAPGRINLLGAHVDYTEGFVLPATIDRAVWLAAAPRDNAQIDVHALNFSQEANIPLTDVDSQAAEINAGWPNYPAGVAWALRAAGYDPVGMDAVIGGDLPVESGLSSSAAVEMAFVMAWEALGGFRLDNVTRAKIGQRVENDFLGVGSGIMDQFACLHGRSDHLLLLDCRSLAHEWVPLPVETAVIIADSGVRRRLADGAYNRRPQECAHATVILRRHLPHVKTLRDVTSDDLAQHGHLLPPTLRKRVQHVTGENGRVLAGVEALRRGDMDTFAQLVRQSHLSSRDNYDSSIPELDVLAAAAWDVPGCYGARFGGGGSGGMVQVLAAPTAVAAIQQAMINAFHTEFGRTPSTFVTHIADGAETIN